MRRTNRTERTLRFDVGTYRILALLLAVAVFGLSLLPSQWKLRLHTRGELHIPLHFVVFGLVTIIAQRCAKSSWSRCLMLLCAWLLGVSIEYTEAMRFRGPVEMLDVGVDSIAVLAGYVLNRILPGDTMID